MTHTDLWQAVRTGLEAILPAHCLVCEQRCYRPTWLCRACEQAVERSACCCEWSTAFAQLGGGCAQCRTFHGMLNDAPLTNVDVPLLNTGVIQRLIQRWKFHNQPQLTNLLLHLALSGQTLRPPTAKVLVPMPMHWWKRYRRGYNQSALLARGLARFWRQSGYDIDINATVLKNRFRSRDQHTLNRKQRFAAAEQQFRVSGDIAGKQFLLVDDVITTGATLKAAANVLRQAGAASVSGWCLAKTP